MLTAVPVVANSALSRRGYSSSTWRLTILMTGKRIFASTVLFHPSHIAAHMFPSTTSHSHPHFFALRVLPAPLSCAGVIVLHILFVFVLVVHWSQSCIISFGGCFNISSITITWSSFDNRKKSYNLLLHGMRPQRRFIPFENPPTAAGSTFSPLIVNWRETRSDARGAKWRICVICIYDCVGLKAWKG
jgi:hypothetical protein